MMKYSHIFLLLLSFSLLLVVNDINARDFHNPSERQIAKTAFTPEQGQVFLDIGVFGQGLAEVAGAIGFKYAPNDRVSVGMNLAHLGFGIVSIESKYNFIDTDKFGFGLKLDFMWAHGSWMWFLEPEMREAMRGVDLYIIPVRLIWSVIISKSWQLDFLASYEHAETTGNLTESSYFYNGYLGVRRVLVEPVLRYYSSDRFSLNFAVELPLYSWQFTSLEAEVELADGIIGGVKTAGVKNRVMIDKWTTSFGITTELKKNIYLNINLHVGAFSEQLYGRKLNISSGVQWRF